MAWNSVLVDGYTFVIAEIGSNHNQDLSCALDLIDAAAESGAQAVKFQSIRPDRLVHPQQITRDDQALFEQIQLNEEWYAPLFARAAQKNVLCFSAPTYLEAVQLLADRGARLMKVASPQTYGFPQIIDAVARTELPVIMSTGYCEIPEISRAVDRFTAEGSKDNLLLLHCVSNYPTAPRDANLRFMDTLRERFRLPVGVSDHTLGWAVAVAAVARGASVIEKHITFSREQSGPDHHFALEIPEFKEMISQIREVESALGDGKKEELTLFERDFRDSLIEYPFARTDLACGAVLRRDDIYFRRLKTGGGLSAWDCDALIGRKIRHAVKRDDPITADCVEDDYE